VCGRQGLSLIESRGAGVRAAAFALVGEDAVSAALDAVLAVLPDARRSGSGWSARCPAHDDRTASLSVSPGTTRDVVVTCFAGCKLDAVIRALGLDSAAILGAGRRP